MADRGIIFSGPMVCALIAGTKTQTRRIPTRLLWCVKPGDRFYVREALRQCEASGRLLYAADDAPVQLERLPAGFMPRRANLPGMLMPRWASRLTLIVKRAWAEPLHAISAEDATAEGIHETSFYDGAEKKVSAGAPWSAERLAYADLWNSLHSGAAHGWEANPEIIALEFEVIRASIDSL